MNKYMTRRGFTLIELLVVVLIIGILAAVALPQYQLAVLKSRYVQLQTVVNALVMAEETYYLEHGAYTSNLTDLDITYPTVQDYNFYTWFNATQTQGIVSGRYKDLIYLGSLFNINARECRAITTNAQAVAVCKKLGGVYVATYGDWESYKLP